MGSTTQSISIHELDDITRQCAALHEDWQRFYHIAASPNGSGASQQNLAFIQLQSRLSCDYPILTHWRKGNLGLSSCISKLVARAGTLEAFASEARAGQGPLVQEWHGVNDAITRVRRMLEEARERAKAGKPVRLPREIAAPTVREPWPIQSMARRAGAACAVLAACVVLFFILRPFVLETALFRWVDKSYTAWQMRNGLPAAINSAAQQD